MLKYWHGVKIAAAVGAATLTLVSATNSSASAHGAVSIENDVCKLRIGAMFMHFTGYQPQNSRAEFCQDIPEVGRAIIVLDFIDAALRDLPVTFEIVRADSTGLVPDIASVDEKRIVFVAPRRSYPNGSIKADISFLEAGDYLGMVMVGGTEQQIATFPFSVGKDFFWRNIAIMVVALCAAAGGVFAWTWRREQLARLQT